MSIPHQVDCFVWSNAPPCVLQSFGAWEVPGRTLTCPGLVRPLLEEIKFRPGAKGPALSLGGEKLR